MGKIHALKTWPEYYHAVDAGDKTVEIRKDDRGFDVGDILVLYEFDPSSELGYTGELTSRRVTHVLREPWVPEGFVALSITPVTESFEIQRLRAALERIARATMSMCADSDDFPRMLKRIAREALGEEATPSDE